MSDADPREALRKWRDDEALTLAEAGQLLGCDGSYVGHIESGRRLPNRRIANAILKHAGIAQEAWDTVGRHGQSSTS